jgi:hypothetical protein
MIGLAPLAKKEPTTKATEPTASAAAATVKQVENKEA